VKFKLISSLSKYLLTNAPLPFLLETSLFSLFPVTLAIMASFSNDASFFIQLTDSNYCKDLLIPFGHPPSSVVLSDKLLDLGKL